MTDDDFQNIRHFCCSLYMYFRRNSETGHGIYRPPTQVDWLFVGWLRSERKQIRANHYGRRARISYSAAFGLDFLSYLDLAMQFTI